MFNFFSKARKAAKPAEVAEAATTKSYSGSFPVDSVAAAESPLWTQPLHEHLAKRFVRKILLLPEAERAVANVLHDPSATGRMLQRIEQRARTTVSKCHPLIDAVATAFSQHRPLTLSPDCIWLAIEQGFAHHVAENAEELRPRLVRHSGKQDLSAEVRDLSLGSFEHAVADWSSQIREASNPVLHEALICDFSTTTPVIRTASEIVLMDCYATYFSYSMLCICGIPKVTVTGTPEDWQRMRARIEVLETFGLEWWVSRLRPILDEFVKTSEGHPSLAFWKAIYKPKQAYGAETVTGWIADLFPYLMEAPKRRRSHIFDYERREWVIPVENGVKTSGFGEAGSEMGVEQGKFPSGLASVPLNVTLPGDSEIKLDLLGGFFAVEQDPNDFALSPVIGWAIAEQGPKESIWVAGQG